VSDRIAQMVIKLQFEPLVEVHFLEDSYGYRPNKSALEAVGVTQERCRAYDWVLEFDIVGLFDNIPHNLLQKAIEVHTDCRYTKLYLERWLKAPLEMANGELVERKCGTPQGGVVSPVLSNLYLHYTFDKWMERKHPEVKWCRYADDGLVHCTTEEQAQDLLKELRERFKECGLELHPEKTQIVYCFDKRRKKEYPRKSFVFLGYCFKMRECINKKTKEVFLSFSPGASVEALKSMREKTKKLGWRRHTELSLSELAKKVNPILNGWINYYGRYYRSELYKVWRHFNQTLVAWARRKYKSLRQSKSKAVEWLRKIVLREPDLFAHWKKGMVGSFI
jgi:RNA-directed DNA polymerase